MAENILSLANVTEWIGRDLGASRWLTLDQAAIDKFAECTGDHQWIHIDIERATRESPFGGTIAHGYLTLSLIAPATFELLIEPSGVKQALNYGFDSVRFIAPVRSGSRVRDRIRIIAVEHKGRGRILVTTENTIEIEGEPKPALAAVAYTMLVIS
jgi:acyl dehydratase